MAFFGKEKKQDLDVMKKQAAEEIALADVTSLVNTMTKHCFNLCFQNPGPSVTGSEQKCTNDCIKKYMQAWDVLSADFVKSLH